jgi:hypothetical protein
MKAVPRNPAASGYKIITGKAIYKIFQVYRQNMLDNLRGSPYCCYEHILINGVNREKQGDEL